MNGYPTNSLNKILNTISTKIELYDKILHSLSNVDMADTPINKQSSDNLMKSLLNSKLDKVVKAQSDKLRRKWRKIVTGDESKRVRDLLKENEKKPKYIMTIDKLYFTFGVLNIAFTQYFLFNQTEHFWIWYAAMMPFLMLVRRWNFKKLGWQYFMLDFCYFTLWSTFIMLFLVRQNAMYFKVIFMYANGPLTFAIILWRNSFVFHDYEKMTSVYLHLYPCLLTYALRWPERTSSEYAFTQQPLNWGDFGAACVGYIVWQTLYYVKTEVIDKEKLDGNPKLVTSLRWLSADKKNSMGRAVLKLCRSIYLFGPTEEYDSTTVKTKLVFMSSQFIYTVITFTPTVFLYSSQSLHLCYIIFIFTMAVYYGASYYIEIFSARYQKQFDNSQHVQQVAQTAAQAAYNMAQLNRSLASGDNIKRGGSSPRGLNMSPLPVGEGQGGDGTTTACLSRTSNQYSNRGGTPVLEELNEGGRTSRSSTVLSLGGSQQGSRADLTVWPEEDAAGIAADEAAAVEWERSRDQEAEEIIAQTTTAIVQDLMLNRGDRGRLDSDDTEESEDTSDSESDAEGQRQAQGQSEARASDVQSVRDPPSSMVQCLPDEDCYIDLPEAEAETDGSGVGVFSSKLHWA